MADHEAPSAEPAPDAGVAVCRVDLHLPCDTRGEPDLTRGLEVAVRPVRLLVEPPWVRSLGKIAPEVKTEGWRFPAPPLETAPRPLKAGGEPQTAVAGGPEPPGPVGDEPGEPGEGPASSGPCLLPFQPATSRRPKTRLRPTAETVLLKERLLYVLQPPLESLLAGRQVRLDFQPYPYQMEGIAFLMPRHAALLADEMGLGKTVQTILALRLLFHAGLVRRALVVCPKPLVHNWTRELRVWAEDLPFEVVGGDAAARRACWRVSNCPVKLVNYELLTRDAEWVADEQIRFDVVVLDEAQRIKNRDSKTAQVVRGLHRDRSWALTGTPVENKPEDLVNLFAFVDPGRIPPETPAKRLPQYTAGCILRRTKEDVLGDLPPKTVRDAYVELTRAQQAAYELAEKEGVVRLNALGDTISVQHVFELVMRLKQICNFDPLTGQSAKLDQLRADLAEVAESDRKAIVFSQWVEPLEFLAAALKGVGPLLFHGRVPGRHRGAVLDQFRNDRRKHVLLMSYGTGSVGLNLQFASYVFLFDRWWNPAVEDQAINRVHRIGQREPVFVTRFVTPGTIESRIAEVLERKRQIFNDLIEQNDPPPSLGLSEEEIFGLFDIRLRPRRAA